jgi:hypothetical protein
MIAMLRLLDQQSVVLRVTDLCSCWFLLQAALVPQAVLAMAPWATCHNHNARTFVQLVLLALLERFPAGSSHVWASWRSSGQQAGTSSTGSAAGAPAAAAASAAPGDLQLAWLQTLQAYNSSNQDVVRMQRGMGHLISCFDAEGLDSPARWVPAQPEHNEYKCTYWHACCHLPHLRQNNHILPSHSTTTHRSHALHHAVPSPNHPPPAGCSTRGSS